MNGMMWIHDGIEKGSGRTIGWQYFCENTYGMMAGMGIFWIEVLE